MLRRTKLPDAGLRLARGLLVAALAVLYAVLMHHVNASGEASALGATLAVLPLLAIGLTLLRSRNKRAAGTLALTATCVLACWQWPQIERHASFIFWLQDVGFMLFLMLGFGRTLQAGRKPLCVQFAEMMHGPLSAAHAHYARRVTLAWTLFFAAMAAISSLLFFLAPLAIWSLFANFLALPLVALMFAAEFLVRRHVLADAAESRPLDALRAYLGKSARAH
ncbi:MAG TPA: hypothetical protein VFX01_04950 [Methylophilaceae bacterium]|nr:hypothetical protein [Methylophilaceae bacterium]